MTTLISGLIDLARGEQQTLEPEEVRLDLVAAEAVERARRNRPAVTFTTDLQESIVQGVPSTIERAVANLLDNAAKWSPPNGDVEVAVRDGEISVRDHGPGIDEEDLPHVFDRFYRSPIRPWPAGLGPRTCDRPAGRGRARRRGRRGSGRRRRHSDDSPLERQFLGSS